MTPSGPRLPIHSRGALFVFGVSATVCSSSDSKLGLEPPDEAASWGAIALQDGALVASTELQPAGQRLDLSAPDDAQVFVAAWPSRGVRGLVPSAPSPELLRVASLDELSLPTPVAAWGYADSTLTEVVIDSIPAITRDAQNAGCEALDGQPAYVDAHCVEFRCLPKARWQGCIARLEAGVCTFERELSLGVSPEGEALPVAEPAPCEPQTAGPPTGIASFDCSGLSPECVFEVPSPTVRARFSITRAKVAAPNFDARWNTPRWPAEPWGIGAPHEIAVQSAQVFLAEVEGGGRLDNYACDRSGRALLSRRPVDALETVTASRSFSGCMDSMIARGEDRLIVLHTDEAGLNLVELSTSLQELRRVLVTADLAGSSRTPIAVASFDGSRAVILLQRGMVPGEGTQILASRWSVDLERFEVTGERTEAGRWDIDGGEGLPNGMIALASSARDGIYFIEPDLDARFGAEKLSLGALWVLDPVWDPLEALLYVPMVGAGSVFALRGDLFERRAAHPIEMQPNDATFEPLVVLPNVFGPGRGLVALGSVEGEALNRRHRASVAPFESEGPRIGLGRTDVGEGSISKLVADGRGAALAVMPWTGELLRITPVD